MPKKGDRSVRLSPPYASTIRKTANYQTLLSLTLSRGELPVMVALGLFPPERCAVDQGRCRLGTKGSLDRRFAAVRVRIADGPPQRIKDKGQQHLPGEEAWLIGEHRSSGEKKYYLANLPAEMGLRQLAATVKARWICEQAHQQLKEELGLDHFEGRSWHGLHRHALMTMIAYAFLQHRRIAKAGRKKKNQRTPTSAKPAGRTPRHHRTHRSTAAATIPALPKTNRRTATA